MLGPAPPFLVEIQVAQVNEQDFLFNNTLGCPTSLGELDPLYITKCLDPNGF